MRMAILMNSLPALSSPRGLFWSLSSYPLHGKSSEIVLVIMTKFLSNVFDSRMSSREEHSSDELFAGARSRADSSSSSPSEDDSSSAEPSSTAIEKSQKVIYFHFVYFNFVGYLLASGLPCGLLVSTACLDYSPGSNNISV